MPLNWKGRRIQANKSRDMQGAILTLKKGKVGQERQSGSRGGPLKDTLRAVKIGDAKNQKVIALFAIAKVRMTKSIKFASFNEVAFHRPAQIVLPRMAPATSENRTCGFGKS